MAKAYLLYGFAGAGKTTLAKRLEAETGAVRFSADAWIAELYGLAPQDMARAEARVKGLIWSYSERLLVLGLDVVLDFGFWSRAERDEARRQVHASGAEPQLVAVTAPFSEMKRRVQARNATLSPETSGRGLDYLWLDDEALELFLTRFEALGSDEEHTVMVSG